MAEKIITVFAFPAEGPDKRRKGPHRLSGKAPSLLLSQIRRRIRARIKLRLRIHLSVFREQLIPGIVIVKEALEDDRFLHLLLHPAWIEMEPIDRGFIFLLVTLY